VRRQSEAATALFSSPGVHAWVKSPTNCFLDSPFMGGSSEAELKNLLKEVNSFWFVSFPQA